MSAGTAPAPSPNPPAMHHRQRITKTGQPFSLNLGREGLNRGPETAPSPCRAALSTLASGRDCRPEGNGTSLNPPAPHRRRETCRWSKHCGSTGTFTMSSGTLKVGLDEIIGDHGVGTFKQSSGSHTIGGGLFVGNNPGSTGSSFTMSSGSLNVAGGLFVASEGSTATFTQTSGSNTVGGDFVLGRLPGTDGTYTMTSGSLLVKGPAGEYIGQNGTGTFTQTSGSNTASKNIFIAQGVGSVGTYNLNSGSVTANFSPPFDATADIINYGSTYPSASGTGTFNVTGTATVTGDFYELRQCENHRRHRHLERQLCEQQCLRQRSLQADLQGRPGGE